MRVMPWTITIAVALTVGLLAAGAVATRVDGWYHRLRKPSWTPPAWAFGPAWTLILALACASGVIAWTSASEDGRWRIGLSFGCNAIFHLIWSPVFFRLRRPDLALVDVACLWLSILAMIGVTGSTSLLAAGLLAPYLLWVTYAAAINMAVVRLNGTEAVVRRRTLA